MAHYTYFDRDYFTNSGNYPLCGKHYECLLQHCFHYASHVSFLIKDPTSHFAVELEQWRDPDIQSISGEFGVLYHACDELREAMLRWSEDLFKLHTFENPEYPEDPVFFRKDGSVFFDSIIHEGECSLYPRQEEDVSSVLHYGRWLLINENGRPDVPAKEHQLPLPTPDEIMEDRLYQELIAIQQLPDSHLKIQTVDEICDYVKSYRPLFLRKENQTLLPGFSCVPQWYHAFEMYLLGECGSNTFTEIPNALRQAGFTETAGYWRFYELLEKYLKLTEDHHSVC